MKALLFTCSLPLLALAEGLSLEQATGALVLADPELRIELVAAEPLVESPCAMAFDAGGRIFVAENRGYPNTPAPMKGRIALLADTDGDGRMDHRTTFAEGLTFPNGVLPWRGGVIVTCAPDVLFLKDTDGDGIADERTVLLTGFATSGSTQRRVNCPTLGPDGWVYFAAGLSGGEVSVPGGVPVKMTSDLRWSPHSGAVENVAGRSQYGMSFDAWGRRFICTSRVQAQHVVLDPRWLRRNPQLAFSDSVQNCPEPTQRLFSAACAPHLWQGGALPERYDGLLLSCDPAANIVHLDRLAQAGGTFSAAPYFEKKEFLASRDDSFRPVFLSAGPDGALYICDMARKVIQHPDYLPEEVRKRTDFETGKTLGRIWRVSGHAKPRKAPAVAALLATARAGGLDAATMNQAWNAGDAPQRALVLRLWLENPAAREWLPDPSVLAQEPDAEVRFVAALALGEIPEGAPALAIIAARDAQDRWTRAAVLSSLAGREAEFLRTFLEAIETPTKGACALLRTVGRTLPSLATLEDSLHATKTAHSPLAISLLLGTAERTCQRLAPAISSAWQKAIQAALPSTVFWQ